MNTVFNKVLGENEKCVFYFYLKNKELSGQPIDAPLRLLPGGRSCANHAPEAPPPGGGPGRDRGHSRALGTCPVVALAPRRLLGKNASFSFCRVPFITKQSYAAAAAKSLKSCPTLQPHRRQPTRLPRPWDSPGKNTGVGCHFLLQRMKVKSESEAAQSSLTLHDPRDCSLPGSSVHGIFQVRVLEWGAIAFSVTELYLCLKQSMPFIKSISFH